jgi:hypothetical protein
VNKREKGFRRNGEGRRQAVVLYGVEWRRRDKRDTLLFCLFLKLLISAFESMFSTCNKSEQ